MAWQACRRSVDMGPEELSVRDIRCFELYQSQPFQAFCQRLGVPLEVLTKTLTIQIEEGDVPLIMHTYLSGRPSNLKSSGLPKADSTSIDGYCDGIIVASWPEFKDLLTFMEVEMPKYCIGVVIDLQDPDGKPSITFDEKDCRQQVNEGEIEFFVVDRED